MDPEETDNSVIESLMTMFSGLINKDAIITVVESCGGDLNLAVDAIMNITNEGNTTQDCPQINMETNNSAPTVGAVQANPEANNPLINQNFAPNAYSRPNSDQNFIYLNNSLQQPSTSHSAPFQTATPKETKSPITVEWNDSESTLGHVQASQMANNPSINPNSAPNSYSVAIKNPNPVYFNKFSNDATQQPSTSHLAPSQKYGVAPKEKKVSPIKVEWNDQIRKIIEHHNKGSRILILMRGAPGCGKSNLAQQLVEMMVGGTYVNFRTHICSTDDYFMSRGKYHYNKLNLSEAHSWNHDRASLAMFQGLSPIVIDNTNIEIWEMEVYARNAVQNGYIIEVVTPNTRWAKNPYALARINKHNVPISSIKRMLNNYKEGITGDFLIKYFNLSYPLNRTPPVLRSMPKFQPVNPSVPSTLVTTRPILNNVSEDKVKENSEEIGPHFSVQNFGQDVSAPIDILEPGSNTKIEQPNLIKLVDEPPPANFFPKPNHIEENKVDHNFQIIEEREPTVCAPDGVENAELYNKNLDVQKKIEEIEKVELEWENGENWEEVPQPSSVFVDKDNNDPKPPRNQCNPGECLTKVVNDVQDWRQISMFMPPWQNEKAKSVTKPVTNSETFVETTTSSTSMELGDFNQSTNNLKVITTYSRNINEFHINTKKEKIPERRTLDKSTTTTDQVLTDALKRCINEDKHFAAFRKLFKNINKTDLRDIFEQCLGDVNWAVEIVLDGVASNQFKTVDEEHLSDEEVCTDMCPCLSAYHIVPDTSPSPQTAVASQQHNISIVSETTVAPKKTSKREVVLSDASNDLKRQIEQNVVIADSHYSQHCLKIMKFRRGIPENKQEEDKPSTSQNQCDYQDAPADVSSDDDEESSASNIEVEKTVNITLGREFIAELDKLFGRTDRAYPDTLVPKINIPVSLLNEINALWMESLMYQLDEHERQRANMVLEDEDFARALALKEAELAKVGKEPEVLDFKEIMDMDLALSIYQRNVAEWRHKEPNDLAAKLTREKLYNLFPDVQKDVLAELLMAHDNNFQHTVEVLLMSTGKDSILKEKNGVNKFVMNMEMQRQKKILEEERKALSEVEWPLLPKGDVSDISVVNDYRDEANRHLQSRNANIQKANAYLSRGMISVASYYRELAEFHKLKFEQFNSKAAASLIQLNAANCPDTATIDLHFLRVSEAKEALDLFIDTHIQNLQSNQGSVAKHHSTLYFITGRGLHSNGRARIKPAIQKRLTERGLTYIEVNPGLLSSRVCSSDKLSHQLG